MIQEVKTTYEQKVKMYMKASKKQLAEMLAIRDQASEQVRISLNWPGSQRSYLNPNLYK